MGYCGYPAVVINEKTTFMLFEPLRAQIFFFMACLLLI